MVMAEERNPQRREAKSGRAHPCITQRRKGRPPSLTKLSQLCEFHLVITSCCEARTRGNSVAHPRVSLLADDRLRGVRFALEKDRLEVSASSPEYGEAKESIEVQYGQDPLQIGFNAQYLLEFLRVVGASTSIRMQVKDAESATEFRPCGDEGDHYRYVLMPLRF